MAEGAHRVKRVGAHVSIAGGVHNAPSNAKRIGATAFALFTKNPRQYRSAPLEPSTVEGFKTAMKETGYRPVHVVPHIGYLVNLGSPVPSMYEKSYEAFVDELRRCEQLGLTYLNIHPGSHPKEQGDEACLRRIAEALKCALGEVDGVEVLLENTAGQGSSVGSTLEQLAAIMKMSGVRERIGICFDTCHAFAAGFELRTREGYEAAVGRIDSVIGLDKLKAVHLNDAKSELGSRIDRHRSLGEGMLGLEPFRFLMNDPRMDEIPMILETPDDTLWPAEIRLLQDLERKEEGDRGGERVGTSARVHGRKGTGGKKRLEKNQESGKIIG